MRGLTLVQPLASLVAIGVKGNETRGWSTSYRGVIAIHAAKEMPGADHPLARLVATSSAIAAEHMERLKMLSPTLPLGAVVCVATLLDIVRAADVVDSLSAHERALGDYGAGRFVFLLGDVLPLEEPYAIRGLQGLWPIEARAASEILARAVKP